MYKYLDNFGYQVYGESNGEMWLSLVEAVLENGENCLDEGRKRIALPNIRVKSSIQNIDDLIINKYGNKDNLQAIIDLTFSEEKMTDIDIIPSFSPGAKSYHQRIKEGRMIEFVVKRLSLIPESKKAVMVFPTYEDYEAVLKTPKDDYLPCIVSIQFRLKKDILQEGFVLDTTFYARSLDIFQKGYGNFIAINMLARKVAKEIGANLKVNVRQGFLDGLIADAHIYGELLEDAKS